MVTIFSILGVTHQPSAFAQGCLVFVSRVPFGPTFAVATSGDYAFFDSGPALKIADVTDPAAPLVVGEIVLPDWVNGITVSGDYVYVGDGEAGLRVIDVSDPSAPVEVGFFYMPFGILFYGVAVSGGFAYVADGPGGVRVIDVSTPSEPVEVGRCLTPVYPYALSGGLVYVGDGSAGMEIFIIGDCLFSDGFEVGDARAWSSAVGGSP